MIVISYILQIVLIAELAMLFTRILAKGAAINMLHRIFQLVCLAIGYTLWFLFWMRLVLLVLQVLAIWS